MSFRPKRGGLLPDERSGEISRATLQIHFYHSLSIAVPMRCLGNARSRLYCTRPCWRAARHDMGGGVPRREISSVEHVISTGGEAVAEKSPRFRFRYDFFRDTACISFRRRRYSGRASQITAKRCVTPNAQRALISKLIMCARGIHFPVKRDPICCESNLSEGNLRDYIKVGLFKIAQRGAELPK